MDPIKEFEAQVEKSILALGKDLELRRLSIK